MRILILTTLAALSLSARGCINWQAGYDEAARRECRSEVDSGDRRACLDRVEQNSYDRRTEERS